MKEVTIISLGTHKSGTNWLLVEAVVSGFIVRFWCYPESLDGFKEGVAIQVPEVALKKAE